nr:uncharacterized protein LOC109159180 [Ipomoea batatas]
MEYLKSEGLEAKSNRFKLVKPTRIKMAWRDNESEDCGVYVMCHMETFMGFLAKDWDCGLVKANRSQLYRLRVKYAAAIPKLSNDAFWGRGYVRRNRSVEKRENGGGNSTAFGLVKIRVPESALVTSGFAALRLAPALLPLVFGCSGIVVSTATMVENVSTMAMKMVDNGRRSEEHCCFLEKMEEKAIWSNSDQVRAKNAWKENMTLGGRLGREHAEMNRTRSWGGFSNIHWCRHAREDDLLWLRALSHP